MSSIALPVPSLGRILRIAPLFAGGAAIMTASYLAGARARASSAEDAPVIEAAAPATAKPGPTPIVPIPLRGALTDARDLECLTQAVYYEARGEPESGQAAVAQVVLNRTRAGLYPRSVCGVVFQHARRSCQFSFACDRQVSRPREPEAWARAEQVARSALAGRRAAGIGSATQFRVAGLSSEGLERIARIGAHVFYRLGHPVRRPAPATLAAPPSPAPTPAPTSEATQAPTSASAVSAAAAPAAPPTPAG